MADFFSKVFWLGVPVLAGLVVTLVAGVDVRLQAGAWGLFVLAAAFGVLFTSVRSYWLRREQEEKDRWDALNKRLDLGDTVDRVLLRNELVRMHREWVEEKGYITVDALEYAKNTYEAYHALGGNGSGTRLWEDIRALPIKSTTD